MSKSIIEIDGQKIQVYTYQTVVVGTGAAGLNAADRLYSLGHTDIAIVTEHMNAGTSRNAGSDKQTYYKLTLAGDEPDSVYEMAKTFFDGLCVDGDNALVEAAMSAQCFLRLVELGVPFPRNRYGEYVGYKTDHDPRRRATSCGPYTSKIMTECLEKSVREKNIPVWENLLVVKLLVENDEIHGLICLDMSKPQDTDNRFVLFRCRNVVYATGGPAGIYENSAYPIGHYGASGIALECGARGKNLTEWQYGIASVRPPWNVSGSFMQVLPRFISTDADGGDEREFLFDFTDDIPWMLTRVFLKGYQWPFDARKVADGSSIIDILVYLETCKGRKVYLDYRRNPGGENVDFSALGEEARIYMEKAGICFGTPVERLKHMNRPAYDFYLDKGIDLAKEPLEVAVAAQHNNGGLSVDSWWRTNIKGLFAVGEVSGAHGVYRPGGAALNSTQVASLRAAQYISAYPGPQPVGDEEFIALAKKPLNEMIQFAAQVEQDGTDIRALLKAAKVRMSRYGAILRNREELQKVAAEVHKEMCMLPQMANVKNPQDLHYAFRLRDILICQYVYLQSMIDYIDNNGRSRGSALYTDMSGQKPYANLPDEFTFKVDDGVSGGRVQEVEMRDGQCMFHWRDVRPLPKDDDFFENVWKSFRENKNIEKI